MTQNLKLKAFVFGFALLCGLLGYLAGSGRSAAITAAAARCWGAL